MALADEGAAPRAVEHTIRVGGVELDTGAYLIRVNGKAHTLPLKEFQLLRLLMEHADTALSTEDITHTVWGPNLADSGTLFVHIRRLRRRLGAALGASHIRTVRGVGYIFDSTADAIDADDA
jgi:DNA-binding response OmpR family regulator